MRKIDTASGGTIEVRFTSPSREESKRGKEEELGFCPVIATFFNPHFNGQVDRGPPAP